MSAAEPLQGANAPLGGSAVHAVTSVGANMTSKRFFRRAPWEHGTAGLIGLGLVMLMQPWSIEVFSYGFTVLLAGVIGYSIAGKLPTPEAPTAPPPQGGATSGPAKPDPRWPAKKPAAQEFGHE